MTDIVLDTFTDTNGTGLASHTPDTAPGGFSWTVWKDGGSDPTYQIQSNKCQPNDSGDGQSRGYNGDTGVSDCTISIEGTCNAVNPLWPEITFRGSAAGTRGWIVVWFAETDTVTLYNPSSTQIDTDSLALDLSDSFRITVTLSGQEITVLAENLTDVTDVTLTATSSAGETDTVHGFGARTAFGSGASDRFDNFLVEIDTFLQGPKRMRNIRRSRVPGP